MTLRELYEQHPEWRDLPLAVLDPDGNVDVVNAESLFTEDVVTMDAERLTPMLTKVLVLGA